MAAPFRILFVCMGNICRSPAAEIVFTHQAEHAGILPLLEIDSAGTIDHHTGKGPDPRMAETLRRRGYPIHGRSRQIRPHDLAHYDWILVADHANLADVRRLAPHGTSTAHVKLLTEFTENFDDAFVPDPYYGGQQGFEHVADLVEDAAQGLLKALAAKGIKSS